MLFYQLYFVDERAESIHEVYNKDNNFLSFVNLLKSFHSLDHSPSCSRVWVRPSTVPVTNVDDR